MRSLLVLISFVFFSTGVIPAQSLTGPIEGFTFDAPTQSLRALNGFAGSATFGPILLSELDFGSVAPHKNYAIAFKDDHCLFVSGLGSGHVLTSVIHGVFGQPEGAIWSNDGSVATIYSHSGKWIQTLTGVPKTPHANPYVDLSVVGGGTLSAIARSTSGKQLAIAMHGAQGGVYLTTQDQDFVPISKMQDAISLAFSEDGASLYALDGAALKLAEITLSDWNSKVLPLAGLKDPFAIRVGRSAANLPLVYVASRNDRVLGVYSPASEKVLSIIHLRFQPTGLQDFGQNSFVIASRIKSSDPLWLFTTAPRPAVYFVPAAPVSGSNR